MRDVERSLIADYIGFTQALNIISFIYSFYHSPNQNKLLLWSIKFWMETIYVKIYLINTVSNTLFVWGFTKPRRRSKHVHSTTSKKPPFEAMRIESSSKLHPHIRETTGDRTVDAVTAVDAMSQVFLQILESPVFSSLFFREGRMNIISMQHQIKAGLF